MSNLSLYYATIVDIICDIMSAITLVHRLTVDRLMFQSYGPTSSFNMESSGQCKLAIIRGKYCAKNTWKSRQKVALVSIFSLGIIIIVFALVRVIETRATTKHVDPIWLALWSMLEASIGKFILRLSLLLSRVFQVPACRSSLAI